MPKINLTYIFDSEEELRAHLAGATRAATETTAAPVVTTAAPVVTTAAPVVTTDGPVETDEPEDTGAAEITDDVDSDGMPYDPDIHASPKSFTEGGNWRSKRGKSKEASAARAAFKAAGGAVEPVAPAATAAAMPGMPTIPAVAESVKAPVSYDKLIDKTMGMMQRNVIDLEGVTNLYKKIGLTDPAVLETNESMRAALFAELCEVEA